MQRHRRAMCQQLIERCRIGSGCRDLVRGKQRIARPGLEAKRLRPLSDSPADAAEPDDAEARIGEAWQWAGGVVLPLPIAHAAIESNDSAQQREQHRDRAVGDFLDAVVGHVADPDATAPGRLEIDVIDADAAGHDGTEVWQRLHIRRRDMLPYEEPDHIVTRPGSRRRLDDDIDPGQQLRDRVDPKQRPFDQDFLRFSLPLVGRASSFSLPLVGRDGEGVHYVIGCAATSRSRRMSTAGPCCEKAQSRSLAILSSLVNRAGTPQDVHKATKSGWTRSTPCVSPYASR